MVTSGRRVFLMFVGLRREFTVKRMMAMMMMMANGILIVFYKRQTQTHWLPLAMKVVAHHKEMAMNRRSRQYYDGGCQMLLVIKTPKSYFRNEFRAIYKTGLI